jgi:hypothetical protein
LESSPSSLEGDWFTHIQKAGKGYYAYQIRLKKNGEFQLYRVNLHPAMRWEEARYEGVWTETNNSLELETKNCRVYTSRNLLARRALLRAFDCDHLRMGFRLEKTESSEAVSIAILSPDMYGENSRIHFHRPLGKENGKWALVFRDGVRNLAWGIDLKRYKKGQAAKLFSTTRMQPVPIRFNRVVETSLEWSLLDVQNSNSPQNGDFIQLP